MSKKPFDPLFDTPPVVQETAAGSSFSPTQNTIHAHVPVYGSKGKYIPVTCNLQNRSVLPIRRRAWN